MSKHYPRVLLLFFLCASLTAFTQRKILFSDTSARTSLPTLIQFRQDSFPAFKDAREFYKTILPLKESDELRSAVTKKDPLGNVHILHRQYYKGIRVMDGQYAVHLSNGKVSSTNGDFLPVENVDVSATVSEAGALSSALAAVDAKVYKWQIPEEEKMLKTSDGRDSSYLPKGELLIAKKTLAGDASLVLAYKFIIYADRPLSKEAVLIDAHTGKFLYKINLIETVNSPGTAATRYSGTQNVQTDSWNGQFRLRELRTTNSKTAEIRTVNMHNGGNYAMSTEYVDNNNSWTAAEFNNANRDNAGLDAHWGTERVFDYFASQRGRSSWDDLGGYLWGYVNADLTQLGFSNSDNAFWDGSRMTYGRGTSQSFVSLDILAHEIAHGICQTDLGLNNFGEAGAINEGLSDIWAACVKQWAAPTKPIWLLGSEVVSGGIRSMSNPNSLGAPDTRLDPTRWFNTTGCTPTGANDNCGVHRNCNVINYWFYLLANGGSGTNDVGQSFVVHSLGIQTAAAIVYQTEHFLFLPANADFAAFRGATITAAIQLYPSPGDCKNIEVTNAWHAVNVGAAYSGTGGFQITGPNTICTTLSVPYTLTGPSYPTTWTATGKISISGSNTVNPVNVVKNGNGTGTLSAVVQLSCATVSPAPKTVSVGFSGTFPPFTLSPSCAGQDGTIIFNPPSGVTIIAAMGNVSGTYVPLVGGGNAYTLPGDVYGVKLTLQNSCASGDVTKVIQKGSCFNAFSITPNPAINSLTIKSSKEVYSLKLESKQIKEVEITDKMGSIIKSFKYSGRLTQQTISVDDLLTDVYTIRIFDGYVWEAHKFTKK